MFITLNKKSGQSTLEYAVVIAIVVAGLIAMQTYVKRGLQGRLRQSTDDIGEQFSSHAGTYNYVTYTRINSVESIDDGTAPVTTSNTNQIVQRTARELISIYNDTDEFWPQ